MAVTLKNTVTILLLSSLLTACGGGGSSDSSQTNNKPTKPSQPSTPTKPEPSTPTKPSQPSTPTKPEPSTPTKPVQSEEQAYTFNMQDSMKLPLPISNNNPEDTIASAQALKDFENGFFKKGKATLITIGAGKDFVNECEKSACPYFSRIWIDTTSKTIKKDSWMYFAKAKQWVALSPSINLMRLNSSDLVGDGQAWYKKGVDFNKYNKITSNLLEYNYGQSVFTIGLGATSIKGQGFITPNGINKSYAGNAKQYSVQLSLTKGEYYELEEGGFWSGSNRSDDASTYTSLNDFRKAHAKKANVLCMSKSINNSTGIVFNPTKLGADLYKIDIICGNKISSNKATTLVEGIKTIANKKVILLSQPNPTSAQANTSNQQFVYAIALADTGKHAQGKAYQVGYRKNNNDKFVNDVAIVEWMKSSYSDEAAINLPTKQ